VAHATAVAASVRLSHPAHIPGVREVASLVRNALRAWHLDPRPPQAAARWDLRPRSATREFRALLPYAASRPSARHLCHPLARLAPRRSSSRRRWGRRGSATIVALGFATFRGGGGAKPHALGPCGSLLLGRLGCSASCHFIVAVSIAWPCANRQSRCGWWSSEVARRGFSTKLPFVLNNFQDATPTNPFSFMLLHCCSGVRYPWSSRKAKEEAGPACCKQAQTRHLLGGTILIAAWVARPAVVVAAGAGGWRAE